MTPIRALPSTGLLLATALLARCAFAATMLATEVQGEAIAEGSRGRVVAVAALPAKSLIRLADGAHVIVAYVEDAREFELRGPGRYRLDAAGPQPLDNAAQPVMRSLPAAYRQIAIDASRVAQFGVVMRGIEPDSLTPRGLQVDVPATLSWRAPSLHPPYTVTIADEADVPVLVRQVMTESLALPPRLLRPGGRYRWSVAGRDANGRSQVRAGSFNVADASLRAILLELQASADESPARRALYAAVLRSATNRSDAR